MTQSDGVPDDGTAEVSSRSSVWVSWLAVTSSERPSGDHAGRLTLRSRSAMHRGAVWVASMPMKQTS